MSRNTYLQLHNIEKNGKKNTLTEISTQPDEKTSLGLEGIRFTSRNQQDSCVYRFELSRGKADFVDFDPKTRSTRYLRTYFNGYGYYSNYSAIINVEYQEIINVILWQKGSKRHSLLEFVCICLCNLLIINNNLYALSLNSYIL